MNKTKLIGLGLAAGAVTLTVGAIVVLKRAYDNDWEDAIQATCEDCRDHCHETCGELVGDIEDDRNDIWEDDDDIECDCCDSRVCTNNDILFNTID